MGLAPFAAIPFAVGNPEQKAIPVMEEIAQNSHLLSALAARRSSAKTMRSIAAAILSSADGATWKVVVTCGADVAGVQ